MGTETKAKKYISTWESRCYKDGIPDDAPKELDIAGVPSYRRICQAILKNDLCLKSLGFTPPKSAVYGELKREEIALRYKNKDITS